MQGASMVMMLEAEAAEAPLEACCRVHTRGCATAGMIPEVEAVEALAKVCWFHIRGCDSAGMMLETDALVEACCCCRVCCIIRATEAPPLPPVLCRSWTTRGKTT